MPEVASVFGAEDGAFGAAGPGYSSAYVVDAAEAGGGAGVLDVPLGFGGEGCGYEDGEGEKIFSAGEGERFVLRTNVPLIAMRPR